MSRMHGAWLVAAGVSLVILGPQPAHAFRTAEIFDLSAAEGGGGSRHFTGSIGDGYTCAVCHTGQEAAPLEISGVPLDGYVPGGTYEIDVLMPPNAPASSLALELTDMYGVGVGSLLLPADPGEQDLCDSGEVAAHRVSLPNDRAVVATDACGAERVRALWTAPPVPPGPIWFHAVVVEADGGGDPSGDSTRVVAQVVPVSGGSAEATRIGSACAVSPARRGVEAHGVLILLLAALGARRARGRRRRR